MRSALRWAGLGIRTKLAILIEVAMLLLGGATGFVATTRQRTMLEIELRRRGLAIAGDLATYAVRPLLANDLATLRRLVNHAMGQDYVRSVSVLDPDGVVVMHAVPLADVGTKRTDASSRTALASPIAGYTPQRHPGRASRSFNLRAGDRIRRAAGHCPSRLLTCGGGDAEIAQARRQILLIGRWRRAGRRPRLPAVVLHLDSDHAASPRPCDAPRTGTSGPSSPVGPNRRNRRARLVVQHDGRRSLAASPPLSRNW